MAVEWVRVAAVDSDADFAAEWVRVAVADFTAADVDPVAGSVADLAVVSVRDLPATAMLTRRETSMPPGTPDPQQDVEQDVVREADWVADWVAVPGAGLSGYDSPDVVKEADFRQAFPTMTILFPPHKRDGTE